ncbi:MAG: NADH-quinone oxidoreductase subunit N [Opitutaceae bacterium]
MNGGYGALGRALLPEALLVVTALLVITCDLVWGRGRSRDTRMQASVFLGLLGVVAAGVVVWQDGVLGDVWGAALRVDVLAVAVRVGVLGLTGLSLLTITGGRARSQPAEYVALMLLATVGFLQMAVAQTLLLAFLGLELASLSLYVLAGYDRSRPKSAEAALKYFLQGGVSAAVLLFGFSLIYGLTGSIDFAEVSLVLVSHSPGALGAVAVGMVLAAFGFKVAVAPFHLWAPDVYEGAPTSSAALIASASKLAGVALFWRLLWSGLGPVSGGVNLLSDGPGGWIVVVALMASVSLVLGNVAALAQQNVRRLMAYSAIGHAGGMALGLLAAGEVGPGPLFYYAATYGLATVGTFGCIALAERDGRCETLADLAGLWRRSPLVAGCLGVFVLSLAGIPPLAGFFGKFVVFAAALKIDGLGHPAGWVALIAIIMSMVALYYYLIVLKQAWLVESDQPPRRIAIPAVAALALVAAAAGLVVLGIFPSAILGRF